MALGTRELLLVIRARDVASRVVREVGTNIGALGSTSQITGQQMLGIGSALTGIGVTLGAVGAAGLAFFNDATDAAIEYSRQAALTKTQIDEVGVSVQDVADIGKRVASEIPAPFDQMQTALYDIFSSMNVNTAQAEDLLEAFSKSAVAGQVDIQTAARSTISIMNAYQLPVSDVNHIMDVQFQLVRKGVGTYEEFNTSLGRAIPAAVAAGQSFETLAGMMAFLTRNGLSTEMAATSAARAMELFADPDKFTALEDLGITVRDASGRFLQMNDIVSQLASNQGWAQMAEPERKQMFEDIFGQGTIQARRFFDLAIPNFAQLNELTGSMTDASGALGSAYQTMFDEPAMKAQLLKNQYEILKVEIGEELIPVKIRLMEQVQKLLDWWHGLSEGTQDLIIKIALFTSTFMVIAGVVLTVVGAFAMLVGALMLVGLSMTAAMLTIGLVIVAIAAIIAIIVLLVIHWDTVKHAAGVAWDWVKTKAGEAWQLMQDFWDWITRNAVSIWNTIRDAAVDAWNGIKSAANTVWQFFVGVWHWFNDKFGEEFMNMWNTITKEVGDVLQEFGETAVSLFNRIKYAVETWWNQVQPFIRAFMDLWPIVVDNFNMAVDFLQMVLGVLVAVFGVAFTSIKATVEFVVGFILALWDHFGSYIIEVIVATWNFIFQIISSVFTIISNFIQLVLNIIQGDWGEAWNNIKDIFGAAWDAIWAALQYVWANLVLFFTNLAPNIIGFIGDVLGLLWQKGWDILQGLWNGLQAIWHALWTWIGTLPGAIKDLFLDAVDWLWDAGWDILSGLLEGMKDKWDDITGWLGDLGGKIADLKGPADYDKRLLVNNGQLIMQGLRDGMEMGWKDVEVFLKGASSDLANFGADTTLNAGLYGGTSLGPADMLALQGQGPRNGIYVENLNVSDEKVVEDLDWWYTTVSTGV